MFASLIRQRHLIWQLTKREILGRYRGSVLGLLWSFLGPLIMLAVYTFVFSTVFNARWGVDSGDKFEFALVLYAGLVVFNFFAECMGKAPGVILANVNLVKKVVFPLEVLPVAGVGAAVFHLVASTLVLALFYLLVHGSMHWTLLLFPVVIAPLVIGMVGVSWMLAATGVYLRDIGHMIGMVTMVFMFISPLFYPVSALPPHLQGVIYLNPLTTVIEEARAVMIFGEMPHWGALAFYALASLVVFWLGRVWFERTRKGFADVL